jgi:hypothetical protein
MTPASVCVWGGGRDQQVLEYRTSLSHILQWSLAYTLRKEHDVLVIALPHSLI